MKRVTQDELENLSSAAQVDIEFDNEENIAVLTVGRSVFYAVISPAVDRAS